MKGKPVNINAPHISSLVVVLLLLSLVPFSSSSLRSADAATSTVTTAISPTDGHGSPASLGTVITSGSSTVPTNLCTANCIITGGTKAGNNLFHSFGDFNIGASDSARFQTGLVKPLPDASVSNILGRVTGGNPSNIFGALDSATYYPSANLFLMNPTGFLFGPHATVNVGGMLAFTTADYLRLQGISGNGTFYADPAQASVLTNAPVAAFGFLGSNPGAITVQGGQLSVSPSQSIFLVGGNVTVQAGTLDDGTTVQPARLSAPGGQINLASVTSSGEVLYPSLQTAPNVNGQSFASMGAITLSQGTILDVSADAAGTVRIRGGQLVMDQAIISADTVNANGTSVAIDINVTGDLSISAVDVPALTARTTGSGDAGEIRIASTNMAMTATAPNNFVVSVIDTHTSGSGRAGDVTITTTDNLTIIGDPSSFIFSIDSGTVGLDGGHGGNVTLTAKNIDAQQATINTGDNVAVNFGEDASGSGGNLTIVADSLRLTVSSLIADSSTVGAGGDITISARDVQINDSALAATGIERAGAIRINADQLILNSSQFEVDNGAGPSGGITITGKVVELKNGTTIASQTFGDQDGGDIKITATNHLTLSDDPTSDGSAIRPSGLFTNSLGLFGTHGNAGAIVVTTPTLELIGGARLDSSTRTSGLGGPIIIAANTISVSGERPNPILETQFKQGPLSSGIYARSIGATFCTGPCGSAGPITITTGSLSINQGARIDSSTKSTGAGGDIAINANQISIAGTMIDGTPGGILTTASAAGSGGIIALTAGQFVAISNGASVSASSTSTGNAGSVTIEGPQSPVQSVLIDGSGSGISTKTEGTGAGGNIFVNANSVTLQNGGTLSAKTSGTAASATGGTITVTATQVELNLGRIDASTGGRGDAGSIHINATDRIALTNRAIIVSASENDFSNAAGNGGTITLHAPNIALSGDAIVSSSTNGPGNAGDVVLETQSFIMSGVGTHGGRVNAITQGPGQGGNITVQGLEGPESAAEVVQLTHGSGLFAQTIAGLTDAQGNAGSIHVQAATLVLDSASQLSTTSDTSTGGAGTIIVDATDSVHLGGSSSINSNSVDALGKAGDITITSPTIWLKGASSISTSTDLVGNAGNITLHTQALSLTEGSKLTSNSGPQLSPEFQEFLTGSAGSVKIQDQGSPAQSVLIDGAGSGIFTDTQGTGAGGNIFVNANSVTLQNGGVLSAVTSGTTATATGGTITVEANQVQLNNGGLITASTTEAGAGGSVTIDADTTFASNASTVSSTATQAQGGDIKITAGQSATLNNGSSISASSTGAGDAGNIAINAGQTFLATNSSVTTQANLASGGTIKITTNPSGTVELTNSLISASVLNGAGGGGSVNIDPLYVLMQNSQILAQAVQGPGGNITINITNGGLFLPDANSTVSASSQFGVNGTVTIQNPNAPAGGQIQPLGKSPLIAASLLNQRCASLAGGEFSSFTVAGRDSLPTEPGSWLTSPLALGLAGTGDGTLPEKGVRAGINNDPPHDSAVLSLRQIAPAGFLTQTFAVDGLTSCQS